MHTQVHIVFKSTHTQTHTQTHTNTVFRGTHTHTQSV